MEESVGIVIPAYKPDFDQLKSYVYTIRDRIDPSEIRIELDKPHSTVREQIDVLPAEVHVVDSRRGKGAAITNGFDMLDTEMYAFADDDGSTPADSLRQVINPVVNGEADLAVGSRRHPQGFVDGSQSLIRQYLGHGFAWLARRTLPISLYDYQCGAKAINAETWATIREDIFEPGFGWDIELIAAATGHGFSISEVPIYWKDQPGSTVSPIATSVELGMTLFRTRWGTFDGRIMRNRSQQPLVYRDTNRE